jgi:hypothetical protein
MGQRVAMYCGKFRSIQYSIYIKMMAWDRGYTSCNRKCLVSLNDTDLKMVSGLDRGLADVAMYGQGILGSKCGTVH